jgi:hypothetical protein
MLFWSPDQLPYLYCYPPTHLLRRRSRINMHAPLDQQPGWLEPGWLEGGGTFPLAKHARHVRQALLEPGDVVFFPSR